MPAGPPEHILIPDGTSSPINTCALRLPCINRVFFYLQRRPPVRALGT